MRTAIITGAGSGIGRATALSLAKGGAGEPFAIVLVGRDSRKLERVAEEIHAAGGAETLVVSADVSSAEEVDPIVQRAVGRFGRIDLLVNNAGSAPSIPLHQLDPRQWHEILNSNLSSAFYLTRAVWPIMQQQFLASERPPRADSVIVNISSMASKDPFLGLGAYAIAKSGVNMLTLVTAREGADVGIRAVCIAPAAVDTPMFRNLMGSRPIPAGIMLDPTDVAGMICQIVSGPLRHCTGDTLFIHRKPS